MTKKVFFSVQFFRTLASLGNVKRVLELGLFTGCSALALAESLPEDGKVISCEIYPYNANLARSFLDKAAAGKKVEILNGRFIFFNLILSRVLFFKVVRVTPVFKCNWSSFMVRGPLTFEHFKLLFKTVKGFICQYFVKPLSHHSSK